MSIPECQLEIWSHQGSITQSKDTYNSIKDMLETHLKTYSTPPYARGFKIFLQGSYGNDTNIYSESDVDIVIRLDDCFIEDWSDLSEQEESAYKPVFPKIYYTLVAFKQNVLRVLGEQYGNAAVHAGNKAIAINANSSRRKADVIVSSQHRRYLPSRPANHPRYVEGICFLNSSKKPIINYPQQHSDNLTSKHQATTGRLKPMIRIFKNIRNRLVKDGKIEASMAPSYYVEGLLYNVPTAKFAGSYQNCVVNVLNWYLTEADKTKLVCANEQYYLLRDGNHVCWDQADCDKFISAVIKF